MGILVFGWKVMIRLCPFRSRYERRFVERRLSQFLLFIYIRLHKPTMPVTRNPPDEFIEAQNRNLQSAVAAALLLLPRQEKDSVISWPTFFSQIAGLSYSGDFRTKVGAEDPRKITKLVEAPGQMERFQSLYKPILQPLEQSGILSRSSSHLEWNGNDLSARKSLEEKLPLSIQSQQNIDNLAKLLASIVAPAARHQSFKGIFTLGFRKSITYAGAKLQKGLFRRK
jgi:translocator assembly and maintenance protein 41